MRHPIVARIETIRPSTSLQWLQGDESSTPRCGVLCSSSSVENAQHWVLSPRCPKSLEQRDTQSAKTIGEDPLPLKSFLDLCKSEDDRISEETSVRNATTRSTPQKLVSDSGPPRTQTQVPLPLRVAGGIYVYTGETSSLPLQLQRARRVLFLLSRDRISTRAGALHMRTDALHAILGSAAISTAVADNLLRVVAVPRSSATLHLFEYFDVFEVDPLTPRGAFDAEEINGTIHADNDAKESLQTFQARIVLQCNDKIDVLRPDTMTAIEKFTTVECSST